MKTHLRYILTTVLVSYHSQSVLVESKAVVSCCCVFMCLEKKNLSWPTEDLKYGFWYYCLSECRICSNLVELLYGSYRCTTWNKSRLLHSFVHPSWILRCGPHASLNNGCFHLKSSSRWLRRFPTIRTLIVMNVTAQCPRDSPTLPMSQDLLVRSHWGFFFICSLLIPKGDIPYFRIAWLAQKTFRNIFFIFSTSIGCSCIGWGVPIIKGRAWRMAL